MTTLARNAKEELAKVGVEVTLEQPPKGTAHRQANGEVERANQTVAGMARTLRSDLQTRLGGE
eukprot:3745388-Amphidinium_carterae.1